MNYELTDDGIKQTYEWLRKCYPELTDDELMFKLYITYILPNNANNNNC